MAKNDSWTWLGSTVDLQRRAYGHDAAKLDTAGRARSIRENVLPLIVESTELLDNVSWKYWAHDEPFVRRDEVLKEAVDIGHFLGNILVDAGITDEEYWAAYREKQAINLERQIRGYAVREKHR